VLSPEDQFSFAAAFIPSNTAYGGSPPPSAFSFVKNSMHFCGVVKS